jgi:N-methylhydantoinase B
VLLINGAAVDPKRQYILHQGDTVLLATPGGGGHGESEARAADALHADRRAGYIDTTENNKSTGSST